MNIGAHLGVQGSGLVRGETPAHLAAYGRLDAPTHKQMDPSDEGVQAFKDRGETAPRRSFARWRKVGLAERVEKMGPR